MKGPDSRVLLVRHPDGKTNRVELHSGQALIGRDSTSTVCLPSPGVSRRHAELFLDPYGRWLIRDLNSKHGIRVDGIKVAEKPILPNQEIRIGKYILSLEANDASVGDSESVVAAELIDDNASEIATLSDQVEQPRIAAAHLAQIRELGGKLLHIEEPKSRLSALCDLWGRAEFRGRAAAVVRVPLRHSDQPVQLMHQGFSGTRAAEGPYISRRLIGFVATTRTSALGSNKLGEVADVLISVSSEVRQVTAVACPLRSDEESLDVLYVDLPPEFATQEWLMLASLVAAEFQRAEATWAGRKQAAESAAILRELEHAARVQKRLLPTALNIKGLDIALGFEPCRWVGGDYLDVVPVGDGRVLLVIGDVCGHGLPAALIASSVHTVIHAGLRAELDIARLPRILNDHLGDTLQPGHFVTMICVLLDPATGSLTSASFGHPPALILGADSSVQRLKTAEHVPLGIDLLTVDWEKGRLDSGQTLVLYTDGITELTNDEEKMLGESGFGTLLKAANGTDPKPSVGELSAALLRSMNEYSGDRLAADDRTYLLVRRLGSPNT